MFTFCPPGRKCDDVALVHINTTTLTSLPQQGKVKMADSLGTGLSDKKESEIKAKKKENLLWDDARRSGKIGITPDLPETLGFYDINAVRREQQRDLSGRLHSNIAARSNLSSLLTSQTA